MSGRRREWNIRLVTEPNANNRHRIYNTGSFMNYGIKYEIPFRRHLNSARRMLNFGDVLWVEY